MISTKYFKGDDKQTLASIQHVGMRSIVPPGGVSWKLPCSLTSVPLHDDDDDDKYNKKYKLNNARTE